MIDRYSGPTFLSDQESLKEVDPEFRQLIETLHRIPFCASFGVSCSGHLREPRQDCFVPYFWGQLNVIVLPSSLHIPELLQLMERSISNHADTAFGRIKHIFGPPKSSKLEVWEIRIGPNGCLGSLEPWQVIQMLKEDNASLYGVSKIRHKEIELFWTALAERLTIFCQEHGFGESDIRKRDEEITSVWDG